MPDYYVYIVTNNSGTLYVGMSDHVQVYAASGARQAVWAKPGDKAILTSGLVAAAPDRAAIDT